MSSGKNNVGVLAVLAKIGPKLLSILAKMVKFLKFGKVAMAAASVASYAILFTWQFALVIVGSVFFHEYGHYWAMKKAGVKTKGIYLLPFVGGVAVAEESFKSRSNEAFIALMGPVFGLLLAAATYVVYLVTKNPFAAAIAGWMSLINIFNLLPIDPLDGGRIIKSVTFSINSKLGMIFIITGTIFGACLAIKFHIFILGFLLTIGVWETLSEYAAQLQKDAQRKSARILCGPDAEECDNDEVVMPGMTFKGTIASICAYLGLGSLFLTLMFVTAHVPGSQAALEVLRDAPSKVQAQDHLTLGAILGACLSLLLIGFFCFAVFKSLKRIAKLLLLNKKLDTLEKDPAVAATFAASNQDNLEKFIKLSF